MPNKRDNMQTHKCKICGCDMHMIEISGFLQWVHYERPKDDHVAVYDDAVFTIFKCKKCGQEIRFEDNGIWYHKDQPDDHHPAVWQEINNK